MFIICTVSPNVFYKTVVNLINALRGVTFSLPSFENSVAQDQLASDEAS